MEMLCLSIMLISPETINLRSRSSNFIGFCTCSRRKHSWGHNWAFWVLMSLITWGRSDFPPAYLSYTHGRQWRAHSVDTHCQTWRPPLAEQFYQLPDAGNPNLLKLAATKHHHVNPASDNRKQLLLTKLPVIPLDLSDWSLCRNLGPVRTSYL